ncbi:MAG TPA: GNAT family N-acetyltransferase [Elusimicrobiota bacterium]|jgi:RimJ/RimL family protein N-acetyltransferase|nr:GNAT family N-acetyltransferase [Elusimicrobiota bacterium]
MKIELRAPVVDDVPVFFAQQREPEALRMASFPSRDFAAFTAHWSKTDADPAALRKTILANGRAAGYVASFERERRREVCYWLGQDVWGKGVATKALADFLKEETRRPLWARVAKTNPASRRVVEKCGFKVVAEETHANEAGEEIEEFVLKLG